MTLIEELRQASLTALDHHRDLLERAAEKIEADQRDAARYRWLRDTVKNWYVGPSYETYNDIVIEGEYLDFSASGALLDAVIDAALSTQGETQ